MSYSSLCDDYIPASSSNYSSGRRGYNICKITPHHMAGVLSGAECAAIFQNPGRQASANYCIGVDGDIVCSVDEENRAWTSCSPSNDNQAITIEVSDSEYTPGGDWPISDASWNSLVNLCVDICRRYGFRLYYDGTPDGSLTRHDMFVATCCPGPTLGSRFDELEATVNAILDGDEPGPTPPTPPEPPTPSGDEQIADIQQWCNDNYGTDISVDGWYGPETLMAITMAYQEELNEQFGAGLDVDGIMGPATRNASPIVRQGAEGNITQCIQSILYCKGYNTNGVDGIYGSATTSAVRSFQANNGLSADGIFGPNTAYALFR